jgi:hypothetical protein
MATADGPGDRSWVLRRLGEAAFGTLATELTGAELQSVLLELMERRASARTPSRVLAQYQRDPFCEPGLVDLRTSVEIDRHALAVAARFEALELSPVAPLGASSTVALSDQHRVLSALRGTEVVSDPTNVLALECAKRLRRSFAPVHLCTSQRVVRAQALVKLPGFSQHFRLFALASGGPEAKDHAFTVGTLVTHVRTLLGVLDRLEEHGYAFGARRVDVLATPERARLGDRIAEALGTVASRQPLSHAYYSGGLRFQLWATARDGASIPLGDGGAFDWLEKLCSNRRAVFVASGLGVQLIPLRFAREA